MSCLLSLFSDISHDLCSSYIDIVHIFLPHWYLWLIIGAFNIRKVNGRMSFWKSIWEKSFGSLPDFGCYYFRCLRVVNSCVFPIEEFNTFFQSWTIYFYCRSENRSLTFLKNCSSNTIHTWSLMLMMMFIGSFFRLLSPWLNLSSWFAAAAILLINISNRFWIHLSCFFFFFFAQVARCLPKLIKLHASHLGSMKKKTHTHLWDEINK